MQLLFQCLLEHTGKINSLSNSSIIQPCGNRERLFDGFFKMLFGVLCNINRNDINECFRNRFIRGKFL